MSSKRVEFTGSQGHALAASLDSPQGQARAYAVFAHCFTCSKDTKAAAYIARALAEAGIGVLRFDFTGLGGSEGDFTNTDFSSNIDDLVAACDWLREQHGAPALLLGHSLGGAAVLAAAHRVPDCLAVATLGAPFDPAHVTKQFGASLALIESEGEAEVQLAGRSFKLRKGFIDDISGQPQAQRIHALRRPLLLLHAPLDDVVGVDSARAIFEAAMHPKSFVALDGADHMLARAADASYAAGLIAAWASRYVGAAQEGAEQAGAEQDQRTEPGTVRVAERGTGAYAVGIHDGRHSWIGDEPVAVGGSDLGPGPYEMLLAALGACTVMTIRMVAQRKGWPLTRASVVLTHAKIHASDCADCETREGRIDRITRRIALEGDLDDAQRQSLLAIADKCPVHRTLHGEVDVQTSLA